MSKAENATRKNLLEQSILEAMGLLLAFGFFLLSLSSFFSCFSDCFQRFGSHVTNRPVLPLSLIIQGSSRSSYSRSEQNLCNCINLLGCTCGIRLLCFFPSPRNGTPIELRSDWYVAFRCLTTRSTGFSFLHLRFKLAFILQTEPFRNQTDL